VFIYIFDRAAQDGYQHVCAYRRADDEIGNIEEV
jgi:hypothetical protein